MTRLALLLLSCLFALPVRAAACPGDCDGDGAVLVNELVLAVGIALGQTAPGACAAADGDGDGSVSIAELVAATNASLNGCPAPTPSPPVSATATTAAEPSATPTETPSPTPSPTATVNRPPQLADPFVFRGFAGVPLALPLGAVDPEGGPLACTAPDLPDGMTLGADQVLRWTPAADQLGTVEVPYACGDAAEPPLESAGTARFRIAADDSCAMPTCTESGCTATVPPVGTACCDGGEPARLPEAEVFCPQGRLLMIGRNATGFGRLHNCDRLRFIQRAQSDAEIRFHVRVSCISTLNRVTISARLETLKGLTVNAEGGVFLPTEPTDGFYERRNLRFPFLVGGPFLEIEDTEANLTVTARDSTGASVSETLRVVITSDLVSDLPDDP